MMLFFSSLLLALLISLLFLPSYKRRGFPLGLLAMFFMILFLVGLATQLWIVPFGPTYWGVSWFPLLFMLVIFTLLFAAPSPYQHRPPKVSQAEKEETAAVSISLFIWILLIVLLVAIVIGFYYNLPAA